MPARVSTPMGSPYSPVLVLEAGLLSSFTTLPGCDTAVRASLALVLAALGDGTADRLTLSSNLFEVVAQDK